MDERQQGKPYRLSYKNGFIKEDIVLAPWKNSIICLLPVECCWENP